MKLRITDLSATAGDLFSKSKHLVVLALCLLLWPASAHGAVDIVSLTATQTDDGVLVQWTTGTEIGITGFNVLRGIDTLKSVRAKSPC